MVLFVHETIPTTKSKRASSSSLARAQGFNREREKELFDFLEKVVRDNNLGATRNYNLDETDLTTFQKEPIRVASVKGRSKIFSISIGERGVNTKAVCKVSIVGCYVTPMLKFKWTRGCDDFKMEPRQSLFLHSKDKIFT